jgi:nucleotide-binding universal stress UspA family protein
MNEDALTRIVVGMDGSPGAEQALAYAIRVARPGHAEVVAVAVMEPLPPVYAGLGAYPMEYPSEADIAKLETQLRREWCAPLAESGLRWRSMVRVGRPAVEIERIARDEHAELIVVGRRGRGSFAELLLGSVSHELSHTAQTPVLIVSRRRGREARPEPAESATHAGG